MLVISYDKTFVIGDFYVSTLLFRHVIFERNPCIPVVFLLHERKLTKTHGELFTLVQEKVPSLNKANNHAIVTDGQRPWYDVGITFFMKSEYGLKTPKL